MIGHFRCIAACLLLFTAVLAAPNPSSSGSAPASTNAPTLDGLLLPFLGGPKMPIRSTPSSKPTASKKPTPSKSKGPSTLTFTAQMGSHTPYHHAGDATGQKLHDAVFNQFDTGCMHNPSKSDFADARQCPNDITIPNVKVLTKGHPTSGTLTLQNSVMKYKTEAIRGALIKFIAGAAQSTINSESSKNVTYRGIDPDSAVTDPRLQRREAESEAKNLPLYLEQDDDQFRSVTTVHHKREPFIAPPPRTKEFKIMQGILPSTIETIIYDKVADEIVGHALLIPDWEADPSDIFSTIMCNLAMSFIKSTVMDVVTTALDVASAATGEDLGPCGSSF